MDEAEAKLTSAEVRPTPFAVAAQSIGSTPPATVVASPATRDTLGPWLAEQWGSLADVDPELLRQLEF